MILIFNFQVFPIIYNITVHPVISFLFYFSCFCFLFLVWHIALSLLKKNNRNVLCSQGSKVST